MRHCGILYCADGCCIRHIHHGLGYVMVHSSFHIDKVEHLLHARAPSPREVRQLVADVFLEGVALPLAHLLDFSVGLSGEGEGVRGRRRLLHRL